MQRRYDFFVNKRNTPHFKLYTKLIRSLSFCLGTNFLLGFIYATYIEQREYAGCCMALGLLMYSMIGIKGKDPRRDMRGLFAVVMDWVTLTVCTVGVSYILLFRILMLVYMVEMIYVANIILKYFKFQKK